MGPGSLAEIAGCEPQRFFDHYFEKQALRVSRNDPAYFGRLLSLQEIDRYITTNPVQYPDIFLVNADRDIKAAEYTRAGDAIDPISLYKLHADGATIVLNQFHRAHSALAELCARLELEFSAPFQANIYLTPPRARGFKAHFDTHDVFILQIHGAKQWRLYGTPVELPLSGQGKEALQENPGVAQQEMNLCAGDTLYIPRGLVHDAPSLDETSLHVTVGILSYTWSDLLVEVLANAVLADSAFRRALPHDLLRSNFDRQAATRAFRDLLARFSGSADLDAALNSFVREFIHSRRPRVSDQLAQTQSLRDLTVNTIIGQRTALAYTLDEDPDGMRLECYGNEIRFPQSAGNAVRYALTHAEFRVGDLPDLDDAGRLVLVRRLIREGMLVQPGHCS